MKRRSLNLSCSNWRNLSRMWPSEPSQNTKRAVSQGQTGSGGGREIEDSSAPSCKQSVSGRRAMDTILATSRKAARQDRILDCRLIYSYNHPSDPDFRPSTPCTTGPQGSFVNAIGSVAKSPSVLNPWESQYFRPLSRVGSSPSGTHLNRQ